MKDKTLLRTGLFGSVVAAICCFTPLLVLVVVGVGASALVGWLDYALFPLLFASLGVVAQALYLQAGKPGLPPKPAIIILVAGFTALLFWLEFRFALRLSLVAAVLVVLYSAWLKPAGSRLAAVKK